MTNRKGHPRCIECWGLGTVQTFRGRRPCKCVTGTPNPTVVEYLASLTPVESFAEWYDRRRAERGLPPFVEPQENNDR